MNILPRIIVLTLLSASVFLMQSSAYAQPKYAKGRILVKPKVGLEDSKFNRILNEHNGRSKGKVRNLNVHIVELPVQANEMAVINVLNRKPEIEFAELDELVEPIEYTPNDPEYSNAWHLPKVEASSAWDFTFGENTIIAILDTGVDPNHPDLVDNLLEGWNFYDDNNDWSDVYDTGQKPQVRQRLSSIMV